MALNLLDMIFEIKPTLLYNLHTTVHQLGKLTEIYRRVNKLLSVELLNIISGPQFQHYNEMGKQAIKMSMYFRKE